MNTIEKQYLLLHLKEIHEDIRPLKNINNSFLYSRLSQIENKIQKLMDELQEVTRE